LAVGGAIPIRDVGDLIEPVLCELGYELVQVRLLGGTRRTLQVMLERTDGLAVTVDDCATASNALSAVLDVEDPIQGAYVLEVSSPGIDRPLVKRRDFERFAGLEARLETETPVEGRKRFRGRLLGVGDEAAGPVVRIRIEEQPFAVPLDLIRRAKLVLNEELLARAAGGRGREAP
jgi:ribosome maturation factor RimP